MDDIVVTPQRKIGYTLESPEETKKREGAWPRTLTVSFDEPLRVAIRKAAKESGMPVSNYLAGLLEAQNPDGFPVLKQVITHTIGFKKTDA